jgi:MSHA pilin protein MshC
VTHADACRKVVRGFTLIELLMVLLLVGVLAIFAAPRLFTSTDFNARGFHDETLAFLRYAQKAAIAQRRTVCVTFTLTSATLKVDNDGSAGCEANLAGPRGDMPGTIAARTGASYGSLPAAVSFDGLGQSSAGQTITVQGVGRSIVIEATTGYVHE